MKQALSILLLTAAALTAQQPSAGAIVEGRVISSADGKAVRKATVLLRAARQLGADPQVTARDSYLTETDSIGHFLIKGVVAGAYECVPSRAGFDAKPVNQFATTAFFPQITVAEGQHLTDVVLRLTPLGVISGRILDLEGYPISGASVEAMEYGYRAGKQQLFNRKQTQSDDRGDYRLYSLFPGTYYVRATVRDENMTFGLQVTGPKPEAFSVTFYPGILDSAHARSVDVLPGGEFRSADIHMQKRPLYSIRGRLPSQPKPPDGGGGSVATQLAMFTQISVQLRPPDPAAPSSFGFTSSNEGYEVPRLPPGSYVLTVRRPDPENPGNVLVARAFVDVTDHDVEGVDLSFSPALEISGVVTGAGTDTGPLQNLQVALQPVELGAQPSTPVKADGTFVLKNVLPDLYRVRVTPVVRAYVKSLKLGEHEVKDGQLDLRRGAVGVLHVTISSDMGHVQGTVTDELGNPAPTINVTMVPDQDKPDWLDRFQNRLTDAQGRYVFPALVPGHYTVFAWKDVQRGAPMDPEFRKPFEKLGVSFIVEAGGKQSLDLKQIDAKNPPKQ